MGETLKGKILSLNKYLLDDRVDKLPRLHNLHKAWWRKTIIYDDENDGIVTDIRQRVSKDALQVATLGGEFHDLEYHNRNTSTIGLMQAITYIDEFTHIRRLSTNARKPGQKVCTAAQEQIHLRKIDGTNHVPIGYNTR